MITTRRVLGSTLLAAVLALALSAGLSGVPGWAEASETKDFQIAGAATSTTTYKYKVEGVPSGSSAERTMSLTNGDSCATIRDNLVSDINTPVLAGVTAAASGGCGLTITDSNSGDTRINLYVGDATADCEVQYQHPCTVNPTFSVITTASVGGVASEPDRGGVAAASEASGGTSVVPYAAGGGAGAFVLLASILIGVWYARRRSRAQ